MRRASTPTAHLLRGFFLLTAITLATVAPTASAAAATGGATPAPAAGVAGSAAPRGSVSADGPARANARAARGSVRFGRRVRAARPTLRAFRVAPTRMAEGTLPRLAVRVDQAGVKTVRLRIVLVPVGRSTATVTRVIAHARTGVRLRPRWPRGARLPAGTYIARVHATGPGGATLVRRASAAGRVRILVTAPAPSSSAPAPASSTVAGGVFPVAGPHSFAGADGRFRADRTDHVHEGQDVAAAEGVPVVAPTAGVVNSVDYQASGAGHYVVVDAADGRAFFFAHCQSGSVAVRRGDAVTPGQRLCAVGSTGRATGPHLHFEIWIGGWRRDTASHPIDPLPQLRAWDG